MLIAVGLGCRRGCAPGDVVAAVEAALARAACQLDQVSALYAPAFRFDSESLRVAALRLSKRLEFIAQECLVLHSASCLTRSERVLRAFGVPSIAETAALAGACAERPGDKGTAHLLGPRVSSGGATCALAVVEEA